MYEHKNEIISSRVGCLGASDANMIANVAISETIPNSFKRRLAVVKGLVEPVDGGQNAAMRLGDDIEMAIYESLHEKDERWQSNYRLESKKYSRPNVKLIAHIDFFLKDDEKKIVRMVECKATKSTTKETRSNYQNQLFVQFLLGRELVCQLGREWKLQIELCHYCTAEHIEFDPNNITINRIKFTTQPFDINKGMDIIDQYLQTLDVYYDDDEIDADMLPANVKKQFDLVTQTIKEIEQKEKEIDEFKKRLYDFFVERGIKSVKNDEFSITLVEPSTSVTFDSKAFLNEYQQKHPILYKRLRADYNKTVNRKGYVKISVKKQYD